MSHLLLGIGLGVLNFQFYFYVVGPSLFGEELQ